TRRPRPWRGPLLPSTTLFRSGPARTAGVGTLAEIVDWHQEADGLLGIVVGGRERFRLIETSVLDDGLYVGRIDPLPEAPRCPLRSEEHTSELQSREKLVCRLL